VKSVRLPVFDVTHQFGSLPESTTHRRNSSQQIHVTFILHIKTAQQYCNSIDNSARQHGSSIIQQQQHRMNQFHGHIEQQTASLFTARHQFASLQLTSSPIHGGQLVPEQSPISSLSASLSPRHPSLPPVTTHLRDRSAPLLQGALYLCLQSYTR